MDGVNGHGVPARWGGRLGEWTGWGTTGTEISIRRVRRPMKALSGWKTAEEWIRRWPLIAVGVALCVGVVVGLRSER